MNQRIRTRLLLSACAIAAPIAANAADTTVTGARTTVVNASGSDVVTIEEGASIIVTGVRGINYNAAPTGAGPVINNRGIVDANANADGRAIDTQTATAERSITINNFATGIFRSNQDAIRILNSGTDVTAATLITIRNEGLIQSAIGQGIDLASIPSATVSITNSGTITGIAGILAGTATIDNSGTIIGTALAPSGTAGSANNGEAIRLNGTGDSVITLRAGSVTTGSGNAGNAINVTGGNSIVNVEIGAVVNGTIRVGAADSGGLDTLNASGTGAGILPSVQNFDRINFLSGDWTLLASAFATAQGASIADGAIVRYGDGGTAGNISGDVENNGLLVYNRTDTYTPGAISGTGAVEIANSGRLALATAGTWSGTTTINAGNLRGDAENVFSANSAVAVGADGTLDLNGFDQVIASLAGAGTVATNSADNLVGGILTLGGNDASTTFSGRISGRGGFIKTGTGTFTLSGANTFLGTASVNGGALIVTGAVAGGAIANDGTSLGGTGTIAGLVTIADGARLTPGVGGVGTLTVGGLVLNAGSILDFDLGAPGDLAASDRIQVNGDLTLDGIVNANDVGGFGFGVYRLIDYSGVLTDNGLEIGAVPLGADPALLSIQVAVPGQVNFIYGDSGTGVPLVQFWDGADGAPDGVVDGGSGSWTNGANNWTRANGTANDAWNNNFAVFQGAAGIVTVDDAIAFTGMQFITGGYDIAAGSGALTISGAAASIRVDPGITADISAVIAGAGGLNKLDSGTLVLSGVNSFAGTTNVAGGTLVLNGSVAGAVDLASGTVLTGGGSAGGTVTVANGATLAPGAGGVGTLTFGGLVLNAGSILAFDLGAPGDPAASDRIAVTGDLTLDGTLNAADAGGFGLGVYRLIDYGGALTDNGLAVGAIPGGFDPSQLTVQTSIAGQVNLVVDSVIPEIQFWDGANVTANGVVDGGSGSWTNAGRNWVDSAGNGNNRWDSRFAVFQGAAGTVTVDDAISVTGLQFMTDGYEIAQGTGTLSLAPAQVNMRVDPGVAAEISANLGGAGGLNKLDAGTLILSGANTYSGATTIGGGTLRVLGGSAIPASSAVTVAAGATLDVAAAQAIGSLAGAGAVTLSGGTLTAGGTNASTTFSGILSGGGGFAKTGTGALTLTGVNSYTGATTISGGTLVLGAGGSIAASSGVNLAASGATLDIAAGNQAIANLTGVAGSRVLLGASTLNVTGAGSTSFGGVISGTGGLTQSGTGTLTLTGVNTYAGATNVTGGALIVNGSLASAVTVGAGGRLGGSGTIGGLTVGGTLAPGNSIGTLNVAGNIAFLAGATLEVETLAGGSADLVTATGAVTISGGTVRVRPLDTSYGVRSEYRIVTAGTTLTGTFGGVVSDLAFLTPTLGYVANGVNLVLTRNDVDLAAVADTANQAAVANALQARGAGVIYNTVLGFNGDLARGAFDALSGEIHADMAGFAARDARLLRDAVLTRAAEAEGGSGLWLEFAATRSHTGGDGGFARARGGTTAFLGGIDADLGGVRLGVAGGYSQTDIDMPDRASTGDLATLHVGAYVAAGSGPLRLRGGIGWSDHSIDTVRAPIFGSFSDLATGDSGGSTFQAFGEAGYRLGGPARWIEPFAGLSAQRVRLDAFTETGGPAALAVDDIAGTAIDGIAGARAAATVELDGGTRIRFDGLLAVRHAFDDAPRFRGAGFADGGPGFGIDGAPAGGTGLVTRLGLSIGVLGGRIGVAYSGSYSGDDRRYGVQASASWSF